MRLTRLVALLTALFVSLNAAAATNDDRLQLGLMKVTKGDGLTDQQAGAIESVLLKALEGTGRVRVIGRADLMALLSLEALQEAAGCSADICMADVATVLGVDLLAAAEVGRVGDVRVVRLKVLAVHTVTVLALAQRTISSDRELVDAADSIAKEIVQAIDKQPSLARNPAPDREELMAADAKILAIPAIAPAAKVQVIEHYVAAFGASDVVALVAKTNPPGARQEVCAHLGAEVPAAKMDVQVVDSHFYQASGQASVDGRDAGRVPGSITVPLCASHLEVHSDLGRAAREITVRSDGPNQEEMKLDDAGATRPYLSLTLGALFFPAAGESMTGAVTLNSGSSGTASLHGRISPFIGPVLNLDVGWRLVRFELSGAYFAPSVSGTSSFGGESAKVSADFPAALYGAARFLPNIPILDRPLWHVSIAVPLGLSIIESASGDATSPLARLNLGVVGLQAGLRLVVEYGALVVSLDGSVTDWVTANGKIGGGAGVEIPLSGPSAFGASLAVGYRFFP